MSVVIVDAAFSRTKILSRLYKITRYIFSNVRINALYVMLANIYQKFINYSFPNRTYPTY